MKNTTWHLHVRQPITLQNESGASVALEPGEYPMRDADLVFYEIGPRGAPIGRLRLSELLKLRGSGAIVIDGAFP